MTVPRSDAPVSEATRQAAWDRLWRILLSPVPDEVKVPSENDEQQAAGLETDGRDCGGDSPHS
jgi:hypothetical protein